MKPKARTHCPGCGANGLSPVLRLPRQPAILNYRFAAAEEARRVPRRDVTLVFCRSCGLVFNSTFDAEAVPYDSRYENRQCFSPAFNVHLGEVAQGLLKRNRLQGGRILEVGCGKGDFLRQFCQLAGATGEGYDTSFEPGPTKDPRGVRFFARYVGPEDIRRPFNAILCRHVVEHVPEIGAFLQLLHALAVAAGDPVVVLETPRLEWILENACLWDVFHEHCNYFLEPALATLCRRAGFRVVRQKAVFGGQYQLIELRRVRSTPRAVVRPAKLPTANRLRSQGQRAVRSLERLDRKIATSAGGRGWAVWGAGAKGVALVNLLPKARPRCVVDSNPAKQGGVLPGTSVRIVGPADPLLPRLGLIVIANPNYAAEIRADLSRAGFSGRILTL